MPESTMVAAGTNPANSFFSRVFESLESGISRVASDIMPNWVAGQLDMQKVDQLNNSTYSYVPGSRQDSAVQTGAAVAGSEKPFLQRTFMDIGTMQITGGTIMIAGALFIGLVMILRKG